MTEYNWIMTPTEFIKTAGTSSNVWIIVGSGAPDGNATPQNAAAKGSWYIRDDATDDQPCLYEAYSGGTETFSYMAIAACV